MTLQSDIKQPNREELLQLAIRTAKEGNSDGARVMLQQVLSEDKRNERAMMWMAKLAKNSAERKQWLKRALKVNPGNHAAKDALARMANTRAARENRTLVYFGVIAGTLFIVIVLVLLIAAVTSG